MANISKSFNFKGGFQVDEDVLIVRGSQVGIGSQVPQESLDVAGNIRAEGLILTGSDITFGDVTFGDVDANKITVGDNLELTATTIGNKSGGTPVSFIGDGSGLTNIPTSQWIDIDVGLGFTSIYSAGNVGVDTNDPRYVFQVGGVPYPKSGLNVNQLGVGIEDGNLDVGNNIRFRGVISGNGSGLTNIDAAGISTGTIDNIVLPTDPTFNSVTADNFFGVASEASNLTPTADAVANSLTATTITGTTIYSDKIQIGTTDNLPYNGQLEVASAENTVAYVLTDSGTSNLYVGTQRQVGANRRFGGLRFGLSDEIDLDVVNYDTGNLRMVLHDGSGGQGATQGQFQWIYGQNDSILAQLDRRGKLTLEGNSQPGNDTLLVRGKTTIESDLSVATNATITGDLTIGGDLTLTGSLVIPSPSFDNIIADSITIGGGAGSGGASISETGEAGVTRLEIFSGTDTVSDIRNGNANFDGSVTSGSLNTGSASVTSLSASTTISGPGGFSVSSTGVTATDITTTNLTASQLSINSISLSSLTASDSVTVGSASMSSDGSIQGTDATFTNITADTGTSTFNNIVANNIECDGFTLPGEISFDDVVCTTVDASSDISGSTVNAPLITANILEGATIRSGSGNPINFTSILNATDINTSRIQVTSNRINFASFALNFNFDTVTQTLNIQYIDDNGTPQYETDLVFTAI